MKEQRAEGSDGGWPWTAELPGDTRGAPLGRQADEGPAKASGLDTGCRRQRGRGHGRGRGKGVRRAAVPRRASGRHVQHEDGARGGVGGRGADAARAERNEVASVARSGSKDPGKAQPHAKAGSSAVTTGPGVRRSQRTGGSSRFSGRSRETEVQKIKEQGHRQEGAWR